MAALDRGAIDAIKATLCDPRDFATRTELDRGARPAPGGGIYVLCPWHAEKSGSCHLSTSRGALVAYCHGCGAGGDVLSLVAAVEGLDIEADFPAVLEAAGELARVDVSRPPRVAPRPQVQAEQRPYPPLADVERIWALARPVVEDDQVAAWLRSRAIDPNLVAVRDLARAVPASAALPGWARFQAQPWTQTGHRLLVPMFDASGAMRSVRARAVVPSDAPKALPPTGYRMAGLVMATHVAAAGLAAKEWGDEPIVFAEGEPDFLTWATRGQTTIGIVGGGWTPAHGERVPAGSRVVLWTDCDQAGERYADTVRRSLSGRCTVLRRPTADPRDVNDLAQAGALADDPELGAVEDAPAPELAVELNDACFREYDDACPEAQAAALDDIPADAAPAEQPAKKKRKPRVRAVEPGEGHGDWRDRLITRADGSPDDVPGNVTVALRFHPDWQGVIAFDQFQQTIVTVKAPPWGPEEAPPVVRLGAWTDADSVRLQTWLRRASGLRLKVGRDAVDSALLVASEGQPVDPPREYLEGLVWDGRSRIGAEASELEPEGITSWLSIFLGVQDSPYVRRVGRWFLIASAARILSPGCKVDNALVLEGPQGALKSTAAKILYSPWYSDTPLDLASKDKYGSIQGVWGFELAEFDQYSRHDQGVIKSFVSSPSDKYRPPYMRRDITVPRRCIFLATINPWGEYLQDATGGRRWWPVRVGQINCAGLESLRDQLWAEAVALYQRGERWYPTTLDEHASCREEQVQRQARDAWEDPVRAWIEARLPGSDVTVAEILGTALGIDKGKWDVASQMRAGAVLRAIGFERQRSQRDGARGYVYRRAPAAE